MGTTFGCVLSTTVTGPTASPEAVRTLAQHAEAVGFEAVWFPDHLLLPRQVTLVYPYAADGVYRSDPDHPFYEPLAVLNFVAGCTQRMRLGTHVLIIPYRHPVFTAKHLATLDVLSGGRPAPAAQRSASFRQNRRVPFFFFTSTRGGVLMTIGWALVSPGQHADTLVTSTSGVGDGTRRGQP